MIENLKVVHQGTLSRISSELKSQARVLDVGFCTGGVSLQILAVNPSCCISGMDKGKFKDVVGHHRYSSYDSRFIYGIDDDSILNNSSYLNHSYYKFWCIESDRVPLDMEHFLTQVDLRYDMSFEDFTSSHKDLLFDLVIIYDVLHYDQDASPMDFVKRAVQLIAVGGLLLISFKNYDGTDSERRIVHTQQILDYLSLDLTELQPPFHYELNDSVIYVGRRG